MREQDTFEVDRFRSSYPESAVPAGNPELERDTGGRTEQARRTPRVLNFGRLRRLAARIAFCSAGALLLAFLVTAAPAPSCAQVSVGISVTFAPPALPVYVQPFCPGPGYIWIPGYWAWDPDFGYYWVPGTWVLAPYPGLLWTPGYWGWYDSAYVWYEGYWGPVVGFYGGINYGCGYNGYGYFGGYWDRGTFYYNRTVNNIRTTNITNVYSKPVPGSATTRRVSYNGGRGGTTLRPTAVQLDARQKGSAPIAVQREHLQAARRDPGLRASVNHGRPAIAATPKPGAFSGPGVVRASRAGAPYKAPPPGRTAHPGTSGKSTKPGMTEKSRPATAPRREAPVEPRVHPAVPRGEPARPAFRPGEPRREQPRTNAERPQMAPRRAPEAPPIAPQHVAPRAAPERREVLPPSPRGGREREEGRPPQQ
jgi:hypothetical protein